MRHKHIPIALIAALLVGCTTTASTGDPIVINAEKTMDLAKATITLIEKSDVDSYAAFKAVNPSAAASFRTFVNNVRTNSPNWLSSALVTLDAYKANKTAANQANLDTWINTLSTAISQANTYLTQIDQATLKKGQ